jgi:S-methylmethionine-dependent homocysteine/selenocysteine methylase
MSAPQAITVLDGPIGTALEARGHRFDDPLWSAVSIERSPDALSALHRAYAAAGAVVHTAATFRTARAPDGWTRRAVDIARSSVPETHRVFGSVSPIADCYHPEDTPNVPGTLRAFHREHVQRLVDSGVDGLLVETFAHALELSIATAVAADSGLPVWASMSPGPDASLFAPDAVAARVRRVADAGADVVLINCIGIEHIASYADALAEAADSVGLPWGAYPNAGRMDGPFGWSTDADAAAEACRPGFEALAARGATVLGGCCGMTPAHIRVVASLA